MLEITTTRHNPLIDPSLAVWSWEIPVYLFVGGIVAGMMVLAGLADAALARGDDPVASSRCRRRCSRSCCSTLGMGALFLDLAHKLYVWRVYITFQPTSPMSWGSWVLIIVYGVLAVVGADPAARSVAVARPARARVAALSDCHRRQPGRDPRARLGEHRCSASRSASTPASCSTRWSRGRCGTARSSGPLFLVSGLSAGAALMHLATVVLPGRPAPAGHDRRRGRRDVAAARARSAATEHRRRADPRRHRVPRDRARADRPRARQPLTSSASHAAAAALIISGPYALRVLGRHRRRSASSCRSRCRGSSSAHRIPHTVVPALLVLVGGFTLRWVMVNAGQVEPHRAGGRELRFRRPKEKIDETHHCMLAVGARLRSPRRTAFAQAPAPAAKPTIPQICTTCHKAQPNACRASSRTSRSRASRSSSRSTRTPKSSASTRRRSRSSTAA